MSNKLCFPIYLAMLVIFGSCSRQDIKPRATRAAFADYLDQRIPELMNTYDIPGTTLVLIRKGEIAWSSAFGYADREKKREMSVHAICRAESISKSVTAWGVMKLAEQGLVDLDDPVGKYLPDWELSDSTFHKEKVTIRRLLSNSGGMPLGTLGEEYLPKTKMPTLEEYLSNEIRLIYEPGSRFEYSNVGFNLLELLIEEITGRDFSEYMATEIFKPLKMHQSSFSWKNNEEWTAKIPMGYDLHGKPVPPYVYPAKASGGLFTTVEDIARFVSAGMSKSTKNSNLSVLTKQSITTIYTPHIPVSGIFGLVADSYGFGHFIETLPSARKAVWHGGQGHGWMTHFHAVPETGDGIVIFTNSQRSWPFIATILNYWSQWNGLERIKFSRIATATSFLWGLIACIYIFILISAWQIIRDIASHKRTLFFSLRNNTANRITTLFCGFIIISALVWAVYQPYLFISSIFPVGTPWLGWALLLLSTVLLLSALFHERAVKNTQNREPGI